jgi:predicted nucleic acid-binding protein
VLARVEIEGGMRSGEHASVAGLFGSLRLLPVSDGIARRAGELVRTYRRSHGVIDLVDYIFAATAQAYDAPLMTPNVEHFPMFEGLRAAYD